MWPLDDDYSNLKSHFGINLCNKVFSCNVFIHSKAEQPQTHHQGNKQIEQTSYTQRGGALKLVTSCNKNFLP